MTFGSLLCLPPDPVLSLSGRVSNDVRKNKMDLGIGVYRDDDGRTPIFDAVKRAEQRLWAEQQSKSYLGPEGDQAFVSALWHAATGDPAPMRGVQAIGGTGALRLAAELLASSAPGRRILVGNPTWSNHAAIFSASGLDMIEYDLFSGDAAVPDLSAILAAIATARAGDVVLLHACCHNPTGYDPDPALWEAIADQIARRGLIALVDSAYQGFGDGWHADGEAVRLLIDRVPELLLAYSCDKNFGVYRDRVGALFIRGRSADAMEAAYSHAVARARATYSMPADHGAAVVRMILEDEALSRSWQDELTAMRIRLAEIRAALARAGARRLEAFAGVAGGKGMFALLAISPEEVLRLARDHAIYLPPTGRINLASLDAAKIEQLVRAMEVAERCVA